MTKCFRLNHKDDDDDDDCVLLPNASNYKNINTFSSYVSMDSVEVFILFGKLTSML
jgi:hypothetical protein